MKPKLENWCVANEYGIPYLDLEQGPKCLSGIVHDHPKNRFEDGKPIRTSALAFLDIKNKIARTRNTAYTLGEPNVEWVNILKEKGYSLDDFVV